MDRRRILKPHGARFDEQGTLWLISDTDENGEKSKEIQQYQLSPLTTEAQEDSENQNTSDTASQEENISLSRSST